MRRRGYEVDERTFSSSLAYKVASYPGVAWWPLGWETEPDQSGIEVRTGRVVAIMVGDDRHFVFDQQDLQPLDEPFCVSCGQIGCHNGAAS
jgi:hypothetical protein